MTNVTYKINKIDDSQDVYELPESELKKRFGGNPPSKESHRILKREAELATKHLRAFLCELLKSDDVIVRILDVHQRFDSIDSAPLKLTVDLFQQVLCGYIGINNGAYKFKDMQNLNTYVSRIENLLKSASIGDMRMTLKELDSSFLEKM